LQIPTCFVSLSSRNFSVFLFNSPHYEAPIYVIFFIILLLGLFSTSFEKTLKTLLPLQQEIKFRARHNINKSNFDSTHCNHSCSSNDTESKLVLTSQTYAYLHGHKFVHNIPSSPVPKKDRQLFLLHCCHGLHSDISRNTYPFKVKTFHV
jgi:hypothetical protein